MNIILLVLGFILLLKGADWFVDGASSIASRFGIPQLIIGLTIVAMGTSLPEAFVSITAALKSNAAITIGNVVGSNILNVGIILGITALIRPLHIQNSTIKYEMPFMMLVTLVLILQGINHTISRFDGIVMWLFFLGYLYYIFKMSKNQMEETEIKKTNPLFIPLGLVCLMVGSNFAVDAATNIAISLGVSQRFIGLTIVALGTSLPELVTSVTAARKGNADIAIGNIIGSNIFNILFVVGSSALITPVPFESHFIIDSFVAILIGLVLYLCTKKTRVLDKKTGILLLVTYSIYFIYLLY
ncbi:calcium/sodium antiporter [uncultured Holdemanella sp.]|uniref:calcium/sodium antiporter n=1 Tax=uncultured Holdemanella sp. TaxID=1763549 RepID=UPI0025CF0139|nr:calcium/sodium antiporter [uncultured Holdemanella sp.]